jgi:hypothetical protein
VRVVSAAGSRGSARGTTCTKKKSPRRLKLVLGKFVGGGEDEAYR